MALIEGCKHSLEITVPAEEVSAQTNLAIETIRKKAHLQGFRPGKAPASLIRQRFKQEIEQEVLDKLLPKHLEQETEKENLRVVGRPNVSKLHLHAGEPLTFTAEFEVAPNVELQEVRGLRVPYEEPVVTDEDINRRIDEIRESKAEFVNLDPRPAQDGDHCLVTLDSLSGIEGSAIHQDDLNIEIGHADTFAGFSDALRGAEPGDPREAEIQYPDNYAAERLQGKTVRWRLTLKALRRKEIPELNDEFAKDLGDYQTMDELREDVRKAIFREREYVAQSAAKNALVDKLVDTHEFPVPEFYVEQQVKANIERQLTNLAAQGVDITKLKLDWDNVKKAQHERALKDVKASLLLEKIAETESIFPTNEEVDREIQRLARQEQEPVAATRMRLEKDGSLTRIAGRIQTDKVLNFLFEHAEKEAVPAAADPAGS